MQIPNTAATSYLKIFLAIAVIINLALIYVLFKNEVTYEVYRAKVEAKQENLKDLQQANKIIDAQRKQLDSAIAKNVSVKTTIVKEYNVFKNTKPNTQKYNDQINDADAHSSEQLKQFFTDL